jgi:hypothetical protein
LPTFKEMIPMDRDATDASSSKLSIDGREIECGSPQDAISIRFAQLVIAGREQVNHVEQTHLVEVLHRHGCDEIAARLLREAGWLRAPASPRDAV